MNAVRFGAPTGLPACARYEAVAGEGPCPMQRDASEAAPGRTPPASRTAHPRPRYGSGARHALFQPSQLLGSLCTKHKHPVPKKGTGPPISPIRTPGRTATRCDREARRSIASRRDLSRLHRTGPERQCRDARLRKHVVPGRVCLRVHDKGLIVTFQAIADRQRRRTTRHRVGCRDPRGQ